MSSKRTYINILLIYILYISSYISCVPVRTLVSRQPHENSEVFLNDRGKLDIEVPSGLREACGLRTLDTQTKNFDKEVKNPPIL